MEASRFVRELIETKEMPADMAALIKENYRKLCDQCGLEDVAVAVRSSGPVSMPGTFETYLNIKGEDDVVNHIIKVWASTFNVQAIGHRVNQHHPLLIDGIGVAILKMVKAKTAGVAFTMHPTTMDDTKIVIEGTWGLGESVVSGAISPDRIVVDKNSGEIEIHVNPKLKQVVYQEKGTQMVDVPLELQNVPCLSEEEIRRLVELAKAIEKYYGVAQDIEWVFDADMDPFQNLFLVQTRNISVVKEKKTDAEKIVDLMMRRVFKRGNSSTGS
jgi:pyruvate,water dikinase